MPSIPPPGSPIAAAIEQLDACTDEAFLRVGIDAAIAAVATELRDHAPASSLAAAWSEVLRHGVAAGVRLAGPADWTWFVSGSVARGEAAPGSDVETMVALGDSVDADGKIELMARAADVHALLERCRIPGDANGVLASRPRFCRRWQSWSEGMERWAAEPREDRGVVMTGLVADSLALPSGADVPGNVLRAQVSSATTRNYPVRQAMLQDATAVRANVPSRLFAKFADAVDIKLAALDPIVKIARWAALSVGSDALSTSTRFDHAAASALLEGDDASSLRDCFDWMSQFRWQMRASAFLAGQPVGDVVSLSEMAPQDRAVLRSVAREVSGMSRKLTYLASASAFH